MLALPWMLVRWGVRKAMLIGILAWPVRYAVFALGNPLWLVVAALPAMILVSPLVNKFYVALGPQAIFVPMMVLALELGALSLQVEAVCGTWKGRGRYS